MKKIPKITIDALRESYRDAAKKEKKYLAAAEIQRQRKLRLEYRIWRLQKLKKKKK